MKYINRLFLAILPLVTILTSLILLAPAQPVSAAIDAKTDACLGVGAISPNGCTTPAGTPTAEKIVATIVNILSLVIGVVAVIMIIIAGFRFVTSGGDASNVASARNTIIYAIVGLVIVAFAQVMVHFVLKKI